MSHSLSTPDIPKPTLMETPRLSVLRPFTLFFTGLPAAGKTTTALAVREQLVEADLPVRLLDGDEVRRTVSADLGFSREDRIENIRRIAKLAGTTEQEISIVAAVSPSNAARDLARNAITEHREFVLIWMATPRDVCEDRDPKGLYAKARAGEIDDFTGVSQPYETPKDADLVIDTTQHSVDHSVELVMTLLRERGLLG